MSCSASTGSSTRSLGLFRRLSHSGKPRFTGWSKVVSTGSYSLPSPAVVATQYQGLRWQHSSTHNKQLQKVLPPDQASSNNGVDLDLSAVKSSSISDPVSGAGMDALTKANIQRVAGGPLLFPWRHTPRPLPRLDPDSDDFAHVGQLLGGNVYSSNPTSDAVLAAYIFMNTPWYRMLNFSSWKQELADNMSWAFTQGVAGILSNAYHLRCDDIAKGDQGFDFESPVPSNTSTISPGLSSSSSNLCEDTHAMVEPNLQQLYQGAHEFGRDHLQIRLECKPTSAKLHHLFVFPFLSRKSLKGTPGRKERYQQLLYYLSTNPRQAFDLMDEWAYEFQTRGKVESTVIAQVLIECDEIFWVKDISTGTIVQGNPENEFRKVLHLVRMEMVVETVANNDSWIVPFRNIPTQWQITDIDDHLEGNLIL